jgi:hypothetical protein
MPGSPSTQNRVHGSGTPAGHGQATVFSSATSLRSRPSSDPSRSAAISCSAVIVPSAGVGDPAGVALSARPADLRLISGE